VVVVAQRVDERVVAVAWERQRIPVRPLQALDLRVVYRGVPSDAGGPDYQDAILCWRGRHLVNGDVEFHSQSSDWYRHGHHTNPAYNRVVLHVVWNDDTGSTVRADGEHVPTLEVGDEDVIPRPGTEAAAAAPLIVHPCTARYATLDASELERAVRRSGLIRFERRRALAEADMSAQPADQVVYTGLLEAMGYSSNRAAFRSLAEAVPYAWLQTIDPQDWEGVLLDAAGLGEPSGMRPPAHLPPDAWRLSRLRPSNHPARRLAAVGSLLRRFGPRLADGLVAAVESAPERLHLRASLMVGGNDHAVIGPGRADEVVTSVVLPFCAAMGPSERPLQLFEAYYSPPPNRWTRAICSTLSLAGHRYEPKTAVQHQGLHHLYVEHCRVERRKGCPLCGGGRES